MPWARSHEAISEAAGRGDARGRYHAGEPAVVGEGGGAVACGGLAGAPEIDVNHVSEPHAGERGVLERMQRAQAARADHGHAHLIHGSPRCPPRGPRPRL